MSLPSPKLTPIQVIGMGLEGVAGLSQAAQALIQQATVLAGSDRLLAYFPDHPAQRWSLTGLEARLQTHLQQGAPGLVVVLTTGDPLFFGLGRQLLQSLPPESLTFHPHVSSLQLAFNRLKLPWQEAVWVSAHGRSLLPLATLVKQGHPLIAVLTDGVNTPGAIARLLSDLDSPTPYDLWVCENLGSDVERVRQVSWEVAQWETFAPLNVVVLQRQESPLLPNHLPLLGLPDSAFLTFRDRPGLMTKQAVRVQILGELAFQPKQVIWDIGAGTGSVTIELARLVPDGVIWAIEQTTAGCELLRQNVARFGVSNVHILQASAPDGLENLPTPDRIFVGGSGGKLTSILTACAQRLPPTGRMVIALATLENQSELTQWLRDRPSWEGHFLQVNLARSLAVGDFTRWSPLNPVILASLRPRSQSSSTPDSPH